MQSRTWDSLTLSVLHPFVCPQVHELARPVLVHCHRVSRHGCTSLPAFSSLGRCNQSVLPFQASPGMVRPLLYGWPARLPVRCSGASPVCAGGAGAGVHCSDMVRCVICQAGVLVLAWRYLVVGQHGDFVSEVATRLCVSSGVPSLPAPLLEGYMALFLTGVHGSVLLVRML
jgi:hypothetical protein